MADATFHPIRRSPVRPTDAVVAVTVTLILAVILAVAARDIPGDKTQPEWHGNSGRGLLVQSEAQPE